MQTCQHREHRTKLCNNIAAIGDLAASRARRSQWPSFPPGVAQSTLGSSQDLDRAVLQARTGYSAAPAPASRRAWPDLQRAWRATARAQPWQ